MSPESLNATLIPFLFAVGSVALGALLALLPGVGARSLGPVQTFSVAAALTVVIVHLIPESADSLGMWALVGFSAGLVAPLFIEALLDRIARMRVTASPFDHDVITAEVGFAGLLIHQVGDGIGLWVTSGTAESSLNAAFALSAHTVPLATLFVLRFATLKGRRSALIHAGGLAAASAVGIIIGAIVPGDVISQFNPWVEAVVAGLLLHVITHDLHIEKNRTTVIKIFDMAALVIGVGVTLLASHQHGSTHEAEHSGIGREAFLHAVFDLAIASAPVLFAGLVGAAAIQAAAVPLRRALARAGGRAGEIRGSLLGAVGPTAASSVLGVAKRLQKYGSNAALVVAFVLAVPALGLETVGMTWQFLGWQLAAGRLVGAVAIAIVVAALVARFARPRVENETAGAAVESVTDDTVGLSGFVRAFDEMLLHVSPWMVVGLIAAAYVQTLMPADQVATLSRMGLDVPLLLIAAVPTYVGAASVTPLAAVLLAKGVSPGAVVGALAIGPAINLAVINFVRRSYGVRAMWVLLAGCLAVGVVLAYGVNAAVPAVQAIAPDADHEHGFLSIAVAVLLLAFTARSLWQTGLRAWVSSLLGMSPDDAEHGHGSGHHGHAH